MWATMTAAMDEAEEQRRRNVTASAPKPSISLDDEFDDDVGPGINGFSWHDIAATPHDQPRPCPGQGSVDRRERLSRTVRSGLPRPETKTSKMDTRHFHPAVRRNDHLNRHSTKSRETE